MCRPGPRLYARHEHAADQAPWTGSGTVCGRPRGLATLATCRSPATRAAVPTDTPGGLPLRVGWRPLRAGPGGPLVGTGHELSAALGSGGCPVTLGDRPITWREMPRGYPKP